MLVTLEGVVTGRGHRWGRVLDADYISEFIMQKSAKLGSCDLCIFLQV